jgi:hypothetical protein
MSVFGFRCIVLRFCPWFFVVLQELLSSLFSLLNGVPHLMYLLSWHRAVPVEFPYRNWFRLGAAIHLNTVHTRFVVFLFVCL